MTDALLADTGPLYAAVDPRDDFHQQAVEELKRLTRQKRRILVAYPILLEAHNLVLRRLGVSTAIVWLADMASASFIDPTPEDYRRAIAKAEAMADQPITLFDATVAVLAIRLKLPVWTYDHHFDLMRVSVWR